MYILTIIRYEYDTSKPWHGLSYDAPQVSFLCHHVQSCVFFYEVRNEVQVESSHLGLGYTKLNVRRWTFRVEYRTRQAPLATEKGVVTLTNSKLANKENDFILVER